MRQPIGWALLKKADDPLFSRQGRDRENTVPPRLAGWNWRAENAMGMAVLGAGPGVARGGTGAGPRGWLAGGEKIKHVIL